MRTLSCNLFLFLAEKSTYICTFRGMVNKIYYHSYLESDEIWWLCLSLHRNSISTALFVKIIFWVCLWLWQFLYSKSLARIPEIKRYSKPCPGTQGVNWMYIWHLEDMQDVILTSYLQQIFVLYPRGKL